MVQALRNVQEAAGGQVIPSATLDAVPSYGNDAIALDAAKTGVALYDASHWGRIQVTGEDRLRFLHNQTTNNIQMLQPGQGCETMFVTSTARTLDLVSLYVQADDIVLLTSPATRDSLTAWMDRFIFPFDKVTLKNITTQTACFRCVGSHSLALLSKLGADSLADLALYAHTEVTLHDIPVRIAAGTGLSLPGYTLWCDVDGAAEVWTQLCNGGAVPLGETVWERLRIEQGRPVPEQELTEDVNPLEAGLWHTISFEKGCYIGQETIARLNTYKGVKQQLWGIHLDAIVPLGAKVLLDGESVGYLTSAVETETGVIGLAYIRTKAGGSGLAVTVNGVAGRIVDVPYVQHDYPEPLQAS